MQNKITNHGRLLMFLTVAIATGLSAAGFVHAEGTVGDLSRIQTETLLLKAKVNRATAQAELDSKSHAGVITSGDLDAPVVKNVYGVGGKMAATFLFSTGITVEGKPGDTIVGGFKVVTVSIDKVELSKDKKIFPVGFSATPPVQSYPSNGTGMSGNASYPPVVR